MQTVSLSSRQTTRSPRDSAVAVPSPESHQAKAEVWLGARSSFGLALPAASPTRSQMYAPRGVWLDEQRLIVCDSGNHRVLIWNTIPTTDGQRADIVLGQVDFESEGPAQGCHCYARGMHLPTGVMVADDKLLVADAWHHRILVWNKVPLTSNQPADYAIGQSTLTDVEPNRGRTASAASLYWPYGLAMIGNRFYVTDTGNRRVLAWNGLPECDQPADLVLGQANEVSAEENRGGPVSAKSFRWPHAVAGNAQHLWVADAGNHRVLGWNAHPQQDVPADWVLGQPDMTSSSENPYTAQNERVLRFPYGLALQKDRLLVADTANNRVLVWNLPLHSAHFESACHVIGQPDFESYGENHWQSVESSSLCWPYGIAVCGHQVAIADSGNNRVMLWNCGAVLGGDTCDP